MNYYLFRQSPPDKHYSIESKRFVSGKVEQWDVIMILKSCSLKISPNTLYQSTETGTVYVHEVNEYEYDLMDAFGMPHANRKHFSIIVPQEMFTPKYHLVISYDGQFITQISTRRFGPLGGSTVQRLHRKMR